MSNAIAANGKVITLDPVFRVEGRTEGGHAMSAVVPASGPEDARRRATSRAVKRWDVVAALLGRRDAPNPYREMDLTASEADMKDDVATFSLEVNSTPLTILSEDGSIASRPAPGIGGMICNPLIVTRGVSAGDALCRFAAEDIAPPRQIESVFHTVSYRLDHGSDLDGEMSWHTYILHEGRRYSGATSPERNDQAFNVALALMMRWTCREGYFAFEGNNPRISRDIPLRWGTAMQIGRERSIENMAAIERAIDPDAIRPSRALSWHPGAQAAQRGALSEGKHLQRQIG